MKEKEQQGDFFRTSFSLSSPKWYHYVHSSGCNSYYYFTTVDPNKKKHSQTECVKLQQQQQQHYSSKRRWFQQDYGARIERERERLEEVLL